MKMYEIIHNTLKICTGSETKMTFDIHDDEN